jgi:MYXO-CTERM domain-containing protein
MLQRRPFGFSLLTSTALIGLAGSGAMLGAMPQVSVSPDPSWAAASLGLLGFTAWLRRRREGRIAARLRGLRLTVTLPVPAPCSPETFLLLTPGGAGAWRGHRGSWQVELRQREEDARWQWLLAELNSAAPPQLLADAASLDELLRLARGLVPAVGAPALSALLDCDLCFPLPGWTHGGTGILALAEGGYALQDAEGSQAVGAALAEHLIRRSSAVTTASV